MEFPRACGLLLHPTSLPGRFGIGDLGEEAFNFIDFLRETGQTYWQILPLVPTGYGDSPYSSVSAFAGNLLLISPQKLVEDGLLTQDVLDSAPQFPDEYVDYGSVYGWKTWLLREAVDRFAAGAAVHMSEEFSVFTSEHAWWLDDYCLFRALKIFNDHRPWYEWPDPFKMREKGALAAIRHEIEGKINAEKFRQFLFFRQWAALRQYANDSDIKIIGDIPIFVALDSADVWCNQGAFKLNRDGSPKVVSGVPPDYFSSTGQRWGNPIYDWQAMISDRFNWWTARIAFNLQLADIVRLDHFIGFARNWEVPGEDDTAENGTWVDVPGDELFSTLTECLGELPLIAEDLGAMTPAVETLRDKFGFPGMRILQYGFGGDSTNRDLPHNYVSNSVAYTGTHDNETCVGWYKRASRAKKAHCKKYLRCSARDIHWHMICAVLSSVGNTALIPVQDILGLGNEARFNSPGAADGNWRWRLRDGELNVDIGRTLREMTELYGRTRAVQGL